MMEKTGRTGSAPILKSYRREIRRTRDPDFRLWGIYIPARSLTQSFKFELPTDADVFGSVSEVLKNCVLNLVPLSR